ncbi:MAG: Asp-tRNA(Asn)/Glu-tRNA(Gln) amidotransferase subunit GatC [Oscillospiraceae bacterium]
MNIDIEHIAKLSKLKIEDEKKQKFAKSMEDIIEMVKELPQLDDKLNLLDESNPMELREDVTASEADKLSRNELLQNAPQIEAGCFVVPRVVE